MDQRHTTTNEQRATLYVVATPIGNLEDITLRALRILKEVSYVLCEDTRVTKKLLSHFDIHTPVMAYHAHSTDASMDAIVTLLAEGKSCALVTDAGTPGISDPGGYLIHCIRSEAPEVAIVPIPGASALVAALSVSGLSSTDFTFLGFLPHKKGRETLFKEIAHSVIDMKRPVIFYESPHRIEKSLASLVAHVPEVRVTILREMTKLFESTVTGTAIEVAAYFAEHQDKVRGEFVVIVGQ